MNLKNTQTLTLAHTHTLVRFNAAPPAIWYLPELWKNFVGEYEGGLRISRIQDSLIFNISSGGGDADLRTHTILNATEAREFGNSLAVRLHSASLGTACRWVDDGYDQEIAVLSQDYSSITFSGGTWGRL